MSLFQLERIYSSSSLFTQLTELKVRDVIGVVRIDVLEYFKRIFLTQLHVQILKPYTELIEGYLAILRPVSYTYRIQIKKSEGLTRLSKFRLNFKPEVI